MKLHSRHGVVVVLAPLVLAACGSSKVSNTGGAGGTSSTSSTSTSTNSTSTGGTSSTSTGTGGAPPITAAWSKGLTTVFSGEAQATPVCVDDAGDVTVGGFFVGTADFGGGPIDSGGNPFMFVTRFKADGTYVWAKTAEAQDGGDFGIACDGAGAVTVLGNFEGTLDLGGTPLVNQAMGFDGGDMFAAGLSASGEVTWSKSFHSSAADATFGGVAMNAAGDAYITGSFAGTVDFGGAMLTSAGAEDAFLVELDPSGKALWGKSFGDATNDQRGASVAVDAQGDVLLAGNFFGSIDLGGSTFTATGTGMDRDVFLAKLDAAGNHVWSKQLTGFAPTTTAAPYVNSENVAVDPMGNVILSGGFEGTVDFGGGPLASTGGTMGPSAATDMYVAKFDPTGAHQWSQRFGDNLEQAGVASADAAGNVLVAATGWGTMNFGQSTLTSAGQDDIFLAKLSPSGQALWSMQYGGPQSDYVTGIVGAGSSAFYAVGDVNDSVDFGSGPLTFAGDGFFYVARIDAP